MAVEFIVAGESFEHFRFLAPFNAVVFVIWISVFMSSPGAGLLVAVAFPSVVIPAFLAFDPCCAHSVQPASGV
jgi:hypothetical protein